MNFPSAGFNRYMVECESNTRLISFLDTSVLIDTWWNVNQSTSIKEFVSVAVLIDTWWNVNTV